MSYIEDRVLNISTEKHPGPWVGKTRIYSLIKDDNWYTILEHFVDSNGKRIRDLPFPDSGLCGTKEWLGLTDSDVAKTLKVKKLK